MDSYRPTPYGPRVAQNLIAGWMRMYNSIPVFCQDPFGNLLELVPA